MLNLHLKPVFEPAMFGLEHAPGSTPPAHPQAQASHADCCPPSESHTAPSQPDSHVQVPGAVQLPWSQEGEHTAAQSMWVQCNKEGRETQMRMACEQCFVHPSCTSKLEASALNPRLLAAQNLHTRNTGHAWVLPPTWRAARWPLPARSACASAGRRAVAVVAGRGAHCRTRCGAGGGVGAVCSKGWAICVCTSKA